MIIQPEKGTRNVNDLFYEAERNRIDMLNREFFQDVELTEQEKDESNGTENLIKLTNYRSQIWVEGETDEENNILVINLKSISKIDSEPTRVDPFRTYEDLQKILNYFYDNKMYHHWLTACLMVSLGRRVGDIISLKWSDLFLSNGEYRERLTTLKEEKQGKWLVLN